MDWSIQDVARIAGTTSRTLRHYDDIGLLPPSRFGTNGYRRYDEAALLRLQRILILRELGCGLPQIAAALDEDGDDGKFALPNLLEALYQQQHRLTRRIASVERAIDAISQGRPLDASEILDGFSTADV